jgi:hypothetical protein
VSWIAVIIAAVAQIVLGYVWFMPMVFGKRWEAASGRTLRTGMPPMNSMIYMVVAALLAATGMALWFSDGDLTKGIISGALVWLYFVVPVSAAAIFYEGRSWMWWVITAGYWLVGLMLMGAIVSYL